MTSPHIRPESTDSATAPRDADGGCWRSFVGDGEGGCDTASASSAAVAMPPPCATGFKPPAVPGEPGLGGAARLRSSMRAAGLGVGRRRLWPTKSMHRLKNPATPLSPPRKLLRKKRWAASIS